MLVCAYDTETTGLAEPIYPVEVGVVLYDTEAKVERASTSLVIRPEGWRVPNSATQVHGISHDDAERFGLPLIVVIATLTNLWSVAAVRVAHNAEYDDKVIESSLTHLGRASSLRRPPGYCTKDLAAPVLNLPPTEKMVAAGYGDKPKSPKLSECYQHFFDEEIAGAHSALADARACLRVFLELMRQEVVTP